MSILARQLAAATGAAVVTDPAAIADGEPLHVHVTDRLFGRSPEQAGDVLVDLGRRLRLFVTLHDVPQPTDGAAFERRRHCYAAVLDAAEDWVVSSHTERDTVHQHCVPDRPGEVVPLPVRAPRADRPRPPHGPLAAGAATIGIFGWIYPGKGHAEAIRVSALLGGDAQERPSVLAIGAAAPGHDVLVGELREQARELGVRLTVTGWLDDTALDHALAGVDVAYAAHANVSASGSLNSWLAVGRRPLVPAGPYTAEMAALRPGTLELYPALAATAEVAARIEARLLDPALGEVDADAVVRPTSAEVAEAYLTWWER